MEKRWTSAQTEAIYTKDADILVSAAAGSGKTAALVERIIESITDAKNPLDLDRLLVVTFTNAAAAEMRQRIGEALSKKLEKEPENKILERQLALLPRASITTIHSFCASVLRSNFHLLGLDPNFPIAETTENELLRLSALDESIEELYEDPVFAEDFLKLTEAYLNIKNPEPFYELINKIYHFVMSLPNPDAYLLQAAERFCVKEGEAFCDTVYAKSVHTSGIDTIKRILLAYNQMLTLCQEDEGGYELYTFLLQEKDMLSALLQAETYDAFYEKLNHISFETIPRAPKGVVSVHRETIKARRDAVKLVLKEIHKKLFLLSSDEQLDIMKKLHPQMRALSELVLRMKKRFDEKKHAKNILNYNDLEHGCYHMLVDDAGNKTELAEQMAEQFDEILIDEYQDTSALQEAIFSAIKKEGSLFLVGDIKQSIYRFRNTNPKLFLEKKERYEDRKGAPERKIILSQNFRSRPEVLSSINYIFERIMSLELGEITYNEEEMLYPGAQYPEHEAAINPYTELCMVELEDEAGENELTKVEAEAYLAARKIEELISGGYQIYDKGIYRTIEYRDICVLMRSVQNKADIFAKIFSACGIPTYSDSGSSFLESEEIQSFLSFLKVIDNPHQDIPLLAVLRSQLYAFSPDELAEIRLADKKSDLYSALLKRAETEDALGEKLKKFIENLLLYRTKSHQMDTAEFVWYLYMQTGFYEAQSTLSGGVLRRLNLRLLYIRAKGFEKTGLKGLYSFIRFIDEFGALGGDYDAARTIGEDQNVVRIMSIHKSKGLEFPVVFLAGMARSFNKMDLTSKVLIHPELGFGPQYVDTDLGIVYDNAARASVREKINIENLSEEMRILYVALTRAKEKLILLAADRLLQRYIKDAAMTGADKEINAIAASNASCYLEWVLIALYRHPNAGLLRETAEFETEIDTDTKSRFSIQMYSLSDILPLQNEDPEENIEISREEKKEDTDILSLLSFAYPYQEEAGLPAKISVSELKRKMMQEEFDGVELYPRPTFLKTAKSGLTAAEKGTLMHTVMEHLDYMRADTKEEVVEQMKELVASGRLTQEEMDAVDAQKVLNFSLSFIGQKIKTAKSVLRELPFAIFVDSEPIFHTKGKVMLQGIIDCVVFEDDGISIIDYKTDQGAGPEEIAEKYRVQLLSYKEACETIYDQKVKHCYLYLFHYDTFIEV